MDEKRREAYLKLTQDLLDCSPAKVLSVLNINLDLVDTGLLSAMVEILGLLQNMGEYQKVQYLIRLINYINYELARDNKIPYARLAEELLQCDQGEERKILNAHPELIDEDLVQIMRELASFLKEQGDQNYLWLQSFANDVAEELKNSSLQLRLVHDLLHCPPQQEQRLLTVQQELLTPDLIDTIHAVANRLEYQGEQPQAHSLRQLSDTLATQIKVIAMRQAYFDQMVSAFAVQQSMSLLESMEEVSDEDDSDPVTDIEHLMLDKPECHLSSKLEDEDQEFIPLLYSQVIKCVRSDSALRSFLLKNLEQFNDNFAFRWQNFLTAQLTNQSEDTVFSQSEGIKRFSNLIAQLSQGNVSNHVEIAIAGLEALAANCVDRIPSYWYALLKNSLANCYQWRILGDQTNNIETAIRHYDEALVIFTKYELDEEVAEQNACLALAYRSRVLGDRTENLEKAIYHLEQALPALSNDLQAYATCQWNLGLVYSERLQGDRKQNIERAIYYYNQALLVKTKQASPEDWAKIQTNLGHVYRHYWVGQLVRTMGIAERHYKASLEVFTRESFPLQWANTHFNLGLACRDHFVENWAKMIKKEIFHYNQVLLVITPDEFPTDCVRTLGELGIAYRHAHCCQSAYGEPSSSTPETFTINAYNSFITAIDCIEDMRNVIISGDEAKHKFGERWNQIYQHTVETCVELNKLTEAVEYAERSKARNLVELLSHKRILPNQNLYASESEYQTVCEQLEQLRRAILTKQRNLANVSISQGHEAINRSRINKLRQDLDTLQQQQQNLLAEINQVDPIFKLTQKVEPVSFNAIQALLDDTTAIVEWFVTDTSTRTPNHILAFIITRHSEPEVICSEQADQIKNLYREYRKISPSSEDFEGSLQKFSEILQINQICSEINKIFEKQGRICDRLILVPHRHLHLLPLHALPCADAELLIDRFAKGISYAPSCQLLQIAQEQARHRSGFDRLFAIQNPYPTDKGKLTSSKLEVTQILQNFDPDSSTVLAQQEATMTNLMVSQKEPLSLAHCLHFSCHGEFDSHTPLNSRLFLANSENQVQSSNCDLTLEDIFEKLDLTHCRLVTLAACDSGMTDASSLSDEYIGLPSGFLYSGSPSVMSSLWKAPDWATALLMIQFYQQLKQVGEIGFGTTAAILKKSQNWLRQLTLKELEQFVEELDPELRKPLERYLKRKRELTGLGHGQPLYSHPYYWAAFTAIGF